jgi:glutamate/aspartate transport system ATP-binding protein
MVFQHFELFPHLSVTENLTLAQIKVLGRSVDDAKARGLKMLDRVGLMVHKDKFPGPALGRPAAARGDRARAEHGPHRDALRRADLGAGPRDGGRGAGRDGQAGHEGMTMMCVTHEMGFAKKVSHRVIFMDHGKIVEDCLKADFFGDPDARSPRAKDFLSKILQH